jgi:hypothetical protein
MMTKKEQVAFRKLELENANLKQQLDKHFGIYRDHLYELIELRTKLQSINEIITIMYEEVAP